MRIHGFRPWAAAVLMFAAGAPAAEAVAQRIPSETPALKDQLEKWYATARRRAPGDWGIAVANQDGFLIWGVQPTRPLVPASTVKLFTTGFARSILGSDARQQTRVVGVGRVDSASGSWIGTAAIAVKRSG